MSPLRIVMCLVLLPSRLLAGVLTNEPPSPHTRLDSASKTEQPDAQPPLWQHSTIVIPAAATCSDLDTMLAAMTRARSRLNDWPALSVYREANSKIPAPTAKEERVVFLGDSITANWQKPGHGGFFPGKPYLNRGIGGQTTPQMLLRIRADVIAHKPKVLVLLAGANDIFGATGPSTMAQIQDNIATMAELATLHGIRVVLASVLPTSNYHAKPTDTRPPQTVLRPLAKIRTLNAWLKSYAGEHGHVYLDYYRAMLDENGMLRADLSDDDVHPNAHGYAIMTRLAQGALSQALAPE